VLLLIAAHHVSQAASQSNITSAQHNNTIQLEGVIIGLVLTVLAGLYRLNRNSNSAAADLGFIKATQRDHGHRLERLEQWQDHHA
jgi:hypothetical protein